MRDAFIKEIIKIARLDKNLMLITADLGFGVLTDFAEEFPKQFLNVGVAEQNMTGIATGLALEGKTVFTYSIANFPSLRCMEQIRNDICYHGANVKIVCVGGGFCYGAVGMSHHATEDLAMMRVLPHMHILVPGDIKEAKWATQASYETQGPIYLRLGRSGGSLIHQGEPSFKFGKAQLLSSNGGEVALLSTGEILDEVVKAHEILKLRGIITSVYSIHTLKPFDDELIDHLSRSTRLIITIEEHNIIGGLGGVVAERLSSLIGSKPPLLRLGLNDCFSSEIGDQNYLREFYGLDARAISEAVWRKICDSPP